MVHNRDLRVCDDINEGSELASAFPHWINLVELIFYVAEFTLEFLPTDKGDVVLIIYISTKPKIYLAWDRVNYSVRGMVSVYRNP